MSHYHSMLLIGISLCLAGWQECCAGCIFNWKRDRHQKSFLKFLWKYVHSFNWLMPKETCCRLIEMLWSQKQGEVIKTRWQVLSNSVWTWNKPKTNLKQKRFNGNVNVIKYNWDFFCNSNLHKCTKKIRASHYKKVIFGAS